MQSSSITHTSNTFRTLLAASIFCAMSLVHAAAAVNETVANGRWSSPGIWSAGHMPLAGEDVRVNQNHTVTYDISSTQEIHSILVNGKLEFARDRNTLLEVGLLVMSNDPAFDINGNACPEHTGHHGGEVPPGNEAALIVGSPAAPIPSGITAKIRLKYFSDHSTNCAPGIITHGGRMDFHGAPVNKTWVKLGATAAAGSGNLTLAEPVDWKVGDRIIVVGSGLDPDQGGTNTSLSFRRGDLDPQTEERLITSITNGGRTIGLSQPLEFEHLGGANESDLRTEVGLLSHNVVIESHDPAGVRGHTMYHTGGPGSISYAEFRHLGKEGVLARYPIHYHLTKDTRRGSYIKGISVWDSTNRWIAIHGTEYLVVRDIVAYKAVGHGIFLEDGSEVYNLFDNNLLVLTYQADKIPGQILAYDKNQGGALWTANARNFILNNVMAENDNLDSLTWDYHPDREKQYAQHSMPDGTLVNGTVLQPDGERTVVPINEMAGGKVKGNELHTHWGWGPWINNANYKADEPLIVEDSKVWDVNYSFDISGDNVIFDGVENYDAPYGFYNLYAGPHLVRNVYSQDISPHGVFMTYRGGWGTHLYENIEIRNATIAWRKTAKNETGTNGRPIITHARNYQNLNPGATYGNVYSQHWFGMEGGNERSDPLLMLILHDNNGPDRDVLVMPEIQSTSLVGVPAGLDFVSVDRATTLDSNGIGYEGRGDSKISEANIPWPSNHPLLNVADNLPPATVILSPQPFEEIKAVDGQITVRGVSVDQFDVSSVRINGVPATLTGNDMDWSVTLDNIEDGPLTITAIASDAAGNTERIPHSISVTVGAGGCLPPDAVDSGQIGVTCEQSDLCMPIKTPDGKVMLICL